MNETNFIFERLTFSWIDYGLLLGMLSLSILIGLYFGFCGHQDTASEYLLGGKQMSPIPIAISLVASNVSGITLLGVPTDIYRFGATYYLYALMLIPVCLISYYVYIPVFYKLQVVSAYEYLMLRFDRRVRLLAAALYAIKTLLYLPIVVYIPALALAQATHLSLHYITPIVCGICILYTTIGGLKAVVWTDTLQFVVMLGSTLGVLYQGVVSVEGFTEVFNRAYESKRLDLDFDMDPTKRDTVLATSVGTFCLGFAFNIANQCTIQKFISLPTKKDVKNATILFYIGMLFILTLVLGIGLTMYANYHDCDPFSAGKIEKHDQILPFYVMEVAVMIPGLAGLFLSGILSAALSSLSACMNSLAASIYEDFVSPYVPTSTNQKQISNILKCLVVLIGLVSTMLVYAVERMGSIVPINFALNGITNGPLLGLFTLGMLFPAANSKGAFYGTLFSLCFMTFVIGGSQIHKMKGNISYPAKPVSIAGCNGTTSLIQNITRNYKEKQKVADIFILFRISHYYYTFAGLFILIISAMIISHFTQNNKEVHADTLSPVYHWISKKFSSSLISKEKQKQKLKEKDAETLINQTNIN